MNQTASCPAPARSVRRGHLDLGAKLRRQAALAIVILATGSSTALAGETPRDSIIKIVGEIQRADYEGDRARLNSLYDDLLPFVDEPEMASRVRYWRGFAKWRRGVNGFNETPTPKDLANDLTDGEDEFYAAAHRDPAFVDAKVGAAACIGLRLFLEGIFAREKDPLRLRAIIAPVSQLLNDAKATDPDNPRLLWVVGPNEWNRPPERGGGQDKAMQTYQTGLESIRKRKGSAVDPLEPSWGEPELLMSLAWSNLNKKEPDLNAAEQYAQAALAMVPYWHYVRDILLTQIRNAKAKHN